MAASTDASAHCKESAAPPRCTQQPSQHMTTAATAEAANLSARPSAGQQCSWLGRIRSGCDAIHASAQYSTWHLGLTMALLSSSTTAQDANSSKFNTHHQQQKPPCYLCLATILEQAASFSDRHKRVTTRLAESYLAADAMSSMAHLVQTQLVSGLAGGFVDRDSTAGGTLSPQQLPP